MKPVQPDEKLAAIVGNDALARTEVTRKLWDYIRSHNLRNQITAISGLTTPGYDAIGNTTTDQTGQDYNALIFGDVTSPFVH